jgi:hypothetical protein
MAIRLKRDIVRLIAGQALIRRDRWPQHSVPEAHDAPLHTGALYSQPRAKDRCYSHFDPAILTDC